MPSVAVQTYPPLGQVTPLQTGNFTLSAVLSVPYSQFSDDSNNWEVWIWHSTDDAEWAGTQLKPVVSEEALHRFGHSVNSLKLYYFCGDFEFKSSQQFTVKYRPNPRGDWIWSRDETHLDNGIVVLQSPSAASEKLEDILHDLDEEWEVSSCLSQTPKTLLWSIGTKTCLSETSCQDVGDVSVVRDIRVGTLSEGFSR